MKIDVISFFIIDDYDLVCQNPCTILEQISQQNLCFVGYDSCPMLDLVFPNENHYAHPPP